MLYPFPTQVFDHHYHFDHLLDTAYEVDESYYQPTGQSPEAVSPQSSQGDLSDIGKHSDCDRHTFMSTFIQLYPFIPMNLNEFMVICIFRALELLTHIY